MTTVRAPDVFVVSTITKHHQILVSGRGFTADAIVRVDGQVASRIDDVGPYQLVATLPSTVTGGTVTVTTAAGTSTPTNRALTYDPADDLALGKPATQSSTYRDYSPSNAVDGNVDNFSHTLSTKHSWWQVDIGSVQQISLLNVWNRTGCCQARDTDYWVFVASAPFDHSLTPEQQADQPGVWAIHETGTMARPTSIPVPAGTKGRYVMVQLNGTNYLALSEIQAFARTP
jgi:hypothetical protein